MNVRFLIHSSDGRRTWAKTIDFPVSPIGLTHLSIPGSGSTSIVARVQWDVAESLFEVWAYFAPEIALDVLKDLGWKELS